MKFDVQYLLAGLIMLCGAILTAVDSDTLDITDSMFVGILAVILGLLYFVYIRLYTIIGILEDMGDKQDERTEDP